MMSVAPPVDKFVYFAAIDRVASYPELIAAIRVALADKNASPTTVARAVERDVAFASRLLRIVNAPEIGLIRPCVSVAHAVSLIGMNRIGLLAEATASRRAIEHCAAIAPAVAKKATTLASIARVLANAVGVSSEQAFTAALLADVGVVAILATYPDHWSQAEALTDINDRFAAERDSLGFNHSELGAEILARWNLPAPIPEAVLFRHDLAAAQKESERDVVRLVALLQAADILAKRVVQEESITEDALTDFAGHPAVPLLGLDAEKIVGLWTALRRSFKREHQPLDQDDADDSPEDVVTFEAPSSSRALATDTPSPYRGLLIAFAAAAAVLVPCAAFALFQ